MLFRLLLFYIVAAKIYLKMTRDKASDQLKNHAAASSKVSKAVCDLILYKYNLYF